MLTVKTTVDVVTEPVTLAEAKAFMLVDTSFTADDTLITSMIKAARQQLEDHTNLAFAPKTLKVFTDKSLLDLPYGPITAISSVVNQDDEVISSDNYTVKGLDYIRIYLGSANSGYFYPIGGGSPIIDSAVSINTSYTITYTTGFVTLPEALKLAIKEQVNHLYNSRGMGNNEMSFVARMLADPFSRRVWL